MFFDRKRTVKSENQVRSGSRVWGAGQGVADVTLPNRLWQGLPLRLLLLAMACVVVVALAPRGRAEAAPANAGAIVLVNSQRPDYATFERRVERYLAHFGVPHIVHDISASDLPPDLDDHARDADAAALL